MTQILFTPKIQGERKEVLRFEGLIPTFNDKHQEDLYKLFGVHIPPSHKDEFEGKKIVFHPKAEDDPTAFQLFKKAVEFDVKHNPRFHNHVWKNETLNSPRSRASSFIGT